MSWKAKRFKEFKFERYPQGGKRTSKHHVPPSHPDRRITQQRFTIDLDIVHHRAYHIIFRNAATYEQACDILWQRFWNPQLGETNDTRTVHRTEQACPPAHKAA